MAFWDGWPLAIKIMAVAWLFILVWVPMIIFLNRKSHPKALFILFFAELWERFSFYGMRALLVLFMIKNFKWNDELAYGIYGAYGALVYATPILGGFLADNFLGYRKSILFGGILMALGHFTLGLLPLIENPEGSSHFLEHGIFFLALSLLVLGNGYFKPNISSFVGEIYADKIEKKDSAFTLFYMGINIGAFLAPLTCGTIGETYGWHYGFSLAGIGMVIGLIVFILGTMNPTIFQHFGLSPNPHLLKQPILVAMRKRGYAKAGELEPRIPFSFLNVENAIYFFTILGIPVIIFLFFYHEALEYIIPLLGITMLGVLFFVAFRQESPVDRDRLLVVLILFFFSTLFWSFFEQAGSSITLFTDRNVDRNLADNMEIPTSQFQGVNPLFIILFAPLFSQLWLLLRKVKLEFGSIRLDSLEPNVIVKFSLGILQLGLGFLVFVYGGTIADEKGLVPLWILIVGYLLHTTGELCLSPVGLSLVTKLSPAKVVAFVMGIWFLSSSLAHNIGALIAKQTGITEKLEQGMNISPLETLPIYVDVFAQIGLVAIGASLLLLILSPWIKRLMHGVE